MYRILVRKTHISNEIQINCKFDRYTFARNPKEEKNPRTCVESDEKICIIQPHANDKDLYFMVVQ